MVKPIMIMMNGPIGRVVSTHFISAASHSAPSAETKMPYAILSLGWCAPSFMVFFAAMRIPSFFSFIILKPPTMDNEVVQILTRRSKRGLDVHFAAAKCIRHRTEFDAERK